MQMYKGKWRKPKVVPIKEYYLGEYFKLRNQSVGDCIVNVNPLSSTAFLFTDILCLLQLVPPIN